MKADDNPCYACDWDDPDELCTCADVVHSKLTSQQERLLQATSELAFHALAASDDLNVSGWTDVEELRDEAVTINGVEVDWIPPFDT